MAFLPITYQEMKDRGWDEVDFVYVSGDAYVDHPSFGSAIITRILESHGYRVGFIAQPDWRLADSIKVFGEPKLGFLVSSGNMDSMVNHYTVNKKKRHSDAYSPGGEAGLRPNHAVAVYGNLIRQSYKNTPIILGGIEASLRRLAHYDYWSDSLKRSILLDSSADIISYGMGEKSIVAIAEALESGLAVEDLTFIPGTVFKTKSLDCTYEPVILPSYEQMESNKLEYARSFNTQNENLDPFSAKTLVEEYPHGIYVVQNPPSDPLTTAEMDFTYDLPYMRDEHPSYKELGGIPALGDIKSSIINNRGCLGECSFCALNFHQGRIIQSRSHESILTEADQIIHDESFKGYITDVGGPTANFRQPACKKQLKYGACVHKRCLSPEPCDNLEVSHKDFLSLLRKLRKLPGVKKVFIRSGIRFDYALLDKDDTFIKELATHHTSGQLRLAPEHVSENVLNLMGKPSIDSYHNFVEKFNKASKAAGKEQYVLPYLMSSHPGATLNEAVELAEFCRDLGYNPEQVQDFYPTPSTISTCIFYTGVDPRTMKRVYVAKSPHEKAMQRALMQYRNPNNYDLVMEALKRTHREDLIGFEPHCLIRPHRPRNKANKNNKDQNAKQSNQRNTHSKPKKTKSSAYKGKTQQASKKKSEGRVKTNKKNTNKFEGNRNLNSRPKKQSRKKR